MLLFASEIPAAARDETYRVLILHSFRHALPVNADWIRGITRGFSQATDLRIEIDIEAPDLSPAGGIDYISNLLDIYRRKYQRPESKPHLLIPTYTPALDFLIEHGSDLFPDVPVVFLAADSGFVASRKLPSHFTGITSRLDIAGTLELALHLQPDLRQVAMIVGAGKTDKVVEEGARAALQPYEGEVEFIWLRGMPIDELIETISTLPRDTAIFYLVQLEDRTGRSYVPTTTLSALSRATKAPIFGLWDTLLEHGIIGGRLATLEDDGVKAAEMGFRILRGEPPATIPILDQPPSSAMFHGGELARWNVREEDLPRGSRVLHRQPSVWEEHTLAIITTGCLIGLQAFFILALLLNRAKLTRMQAALKIEHDRRARAEADALTSGARLARFSKDLSLGAMGTTIAHEISQPLIAIQNYAQASKRRLQGGADQSPKLTELVGKIEREAGRAGDIIQRIRNLMSADDVALHPVSLNAIVGQVNGMIRPGMERRGCKLELSLAAALPAVQADELQIQLVLVNLLQNAESSMRGMPAQADKTVRIETRQLNDREVELSVRDRGSGVSSAEEDVIFQPLHSSHSDGMGMGLSICQSIIEAHHGRIWHTPNESGGTTFRITLPRAAT